MDLTDTYYSQDTEYTLFSTACLIILKINHIIRHKSQWNKKIKIISYNLSYHNGARHQ
jgi:hypothetical protein